MNLTLLPLMGPFHLRFPAYNVVGVLESLVESEPEALATTALEANALQRPSWQDTPEVALPHTVVPWALRRGLKVFGVLKPSPDPNAVADFRRYLAQYPQTREKFAETEVHLEAVRALLDKPLNLPRIQQELLPGLRRYQELREQYFDDGPGTDWLRARVVTMAERILALPFERVTVLASAEHVPFLTDELASKAEVLAPKQPRPGEASRVRALLDFAMQTDLPEPGNVIAKLRELEVPEARYHEANLLAANDHLSEGLQVLETLSRGDFHDPYYLPGYVLTRLGQLRDLAGERQAALRAYRGALALDWLPTEAKLGAEAGRETAFQGFRPES